MGVSNRSKFLEVYNKHIIDLLD